MQAPLRLQDKCPTCGKVARTISEFKDPTANGIKHIKVLSCLHRIVNIIHEATPFHELVTHAHRDNKCKHDWSANTCNKCGANRLLPFQVDGATFIEQSLDINKGACLFDDMGLGKTIQVLSYLAYHPERFPVIFVLKSGILFQYGREILKWLGMKHVPQILRSSKDELIDVFDVVLISYDLLRTYNTEALVNKGFKTMILDECQMVKNPDATRTQQVRGLAKHIEKVIPCSGTPWKNRGSELFTALNMAVPDKFPTFHGYCMQWVAYSWNGRSSKEGGIRNPQQFKQYCSDFLIRRERNEVLHDLPQITRNIYHCELDDVNQTTYDESTSAFVKKWNQLIIDGEENTFAEQGNILAMLSQMRHITGLAKIPITCDFVSEHISNTNRKVIIGVHHHDVARLLIEKLSELDAPVLSLPGNIDPKIRDTTTQKFNNTETCILVASTLASGEGLNLQTCSDMVVHERQWNPANEEQLEARIVRFGQTASVLTATYMTATGTIDDFLGQLVETKRHNFHSSMNKKKPLLDNEGNPLTNHRGEVIYEQPQAAWSQSEMIHELADSIMKSSVKKFASFS